MKNKDKTKKIGKILEENNTGDLLIDMFILQDIEGQIENISDKKLQMTLDNFLEALIKEFGERDLEEEKKVEFYCSSCHKFFPLDKKAKGHYVDMCLDCDKEEQELQEDEDDDYS